MSAPPPIFAFGIANLPMLGWLAAAAAPLVIHLLSRRRYREMPWAAMEYLLAAVRRHARRVQFEQWLLLAIRTLLVALLVLAVAEPYLERAGLATPRGGRTHRVIVIDGSFSMDYRPTDTSCFERARQLARQIVEQSARGDAFSLVLMSSPAQVVVGAPALEPSEILAEIDALRLPHTQADLPGTLAVVERVIAAARREAAHLGSHEVYFLSDLQRVDWGGNLSQAAAARLRRRAAELARQAALVVIDLGQPGAGNVAITELRASEAVAVVGRPVELQATVKNFGRQSYARLPVELLLGGQRVDQQTIELRPEGEAPLVFSHRFTSADDHVVELRLAGDSLEIDNRRWLVVPVRERLRVLCLDGRPTGDPRQSAAGYLALALAPEDDVRAGPASVQVDAAPESALVERDLSRYDCVVLVNVAQFTPSEARLLEAYLGGGGNLIFFLGQGVLADRYNGELGGQNGGPRVLPAAVGPIVAEPQYRLDPLDFAHPIVRAFRGPGQSSLILTPVLKYYRLDVPKDSGARVALATLGGDPLVVEEAIGRGRVVVVATSPEVAWTAMPVWPSFVPLVQEMLAFCAAGQAEQRNLLVGDALGGAVATSLADVPLSIDTPTGRRTAALRPEGDYSTWTHAETFMSGVYTAEFGPPIDRIERYAVNVDTAQSDLAHTAEEELRGTIWPGVPFELRRTWERPDAEAAAPVVRQSRIHLALLYVVLGLLLTETLLAWRFGHHAP
jgi:hypothetical protein